MNKLILPVGLGLTAFAMNFMASGSSGGPPSTKLTAAAVDIKAGERVTEVMLKSVAAPGDGSVKKSAVPYGERGVVVIGQVARRAVAKGELVLFDDVQASAQELDESALAPGEAAVQVPLDNIKCPAGLLQPNAQIGFVVVSRTAPAGLEGLVKPKSGGPPRILGPFRVVSAGNRAAKDAAQPQTIGVAVKPGPEGKLEGVAAEFLQLVGHTPGQDGNEITAIVLFPSRKDG